MQPHLGDLVSTSVAWMDDLWDDDRGLVFAPDRRSHGVRQTAWYALGLLLHDAGEASRVDRARRAVHSVLDNQYDRPGEVYHGTFRRSPDEPDPGRDAVVWRDYDPNWRQFIGTVLALLVDHRSEELGPGVARRAEDALRRAVAGEPPDRVSPAYSNIALMKAWLHAWSGFRDGRDDVARPAMDFAEATAARFDEAGAFDEYNSPTYYGVDLYALGLWRAHPPHPSFRHAGGRIEQALWSDIARYYHAGLSNLCGPFDRAYGMDMTGYASLLGECIWTQVGRDRAPFPALGATDFAHAHDFCFAPCLGAVGVEVPLAARTHLSAFAGERTISTDLRGRRCTAWLSDSAMAGGQAGGRRPASGQYHPATVHFREPSGRIGWIRVTAPDPFDAHAERGLLTIEPRSGEAPVLRFVIRASDGRIDRGLWALPGLLVEVEGTATTPSGRTAGGEMVVEAPATPCRLVLRPS